MGSWNETDAITRLPIFVGDKVVAFVVCLDDYLWRCMSGKPFLSFYKGTYNDYGSLYEYEDKAENDDMTQDLTGNVTVKFDLKNNQVNVKQHKGTIFIKENVFNDLICYVENELKDDLEGRECYDRDSVYPDLYYRYIKLFPKTLDFSWKDNEEKIKLIEQYIPEKLNELKKFCKLMLFCEKTRIDLRNALFGKGDNCDYVGDYIFLKKIVDNEFKKFVEQEEDIL